MTKITKKPKRVKVIYTKTTSYYSEYSCPSCGLHLVGAGLQKNVTRFRCDCGQELMVENNKKGSN